MNDSPSLRARLFVALQYLLPQRLLSGLIGRIARARAGWIRKPLIRAFVRAYRPELADAVQPDPLAYESFNAFFTRALRAEARPAAGAADAIVSPVDGRISALGATPQGRIIQAKGRDYSLQGLLGGNAQLAARLTGGSFMTVYLAPFNYHRIHMALSGTLVGAWYVPGRLFSVNDATAALVPDLFARNERVILEFSGAAGPARAGDGGRTLCRQHGHRLAWRYRPVRVARRGDAAAADGCVRPPGAGRGSRTLQYGIDGHPVVAAGDGSLER